MSDPAMLTCAVAGGIVTGNPNQPATRDQVIEQAVAAARAGASIVHIHARTSDGEMTQAPEDYLAIKHAVREQAEDVVLNFTTGGKLGSAAEERRRSLQAEPEVASLNCGSINFGPDDVVFMNPQVADRGARRGDGRPRNRPRVRVLRHGHGRHGRAAGDAPRAALPASCTWCSA